MADSEFAGVARQIALEHLHHCLGHGAIADILEDIEGGIQQGLFTVEQIQVLAEEELMLLPQVEDYLATREDFVFSPPTITLTKQALERLESDRVYAVYISPIDFDDQYYSLFDSLEACDRHRFAYDDYENLTPIAVYPSPQQAEQVANQIHEATLKGTYKRERRLMRLGGHQKQPSCEKKDSAQKLKLKKTQMDN